jgi:VanZ family protein
MRAACVASRQWLKTGLLACPRWCRRLACGLYLGLIAVLSLLPAWIFPPSPARIPGLDKWVHVAMYGVLGVLLRWAAVSNKAGTSSWRLPLAGAAYGLLMEGLQGWLGGGRSFSWGDAAANLAGVVLFWHAAGWFLDRTHITEIE